MHCVLCKEEMSYVHGHAACVRNGCPMYGVNQAECCSGETAARGPMLLVRSLSIGLFLAFAACACSSAGSSDEPNTSSSFVPAVDAGAVSCGDITCMEGNVCVDQVTTGGAVGPPPGHSYSCATPASSCHGVPDCACMEALCETLSCLPWNAPGKMCCIGVTGKTVQCVIQRG